MKLYELAKGYFKPLFDQTIKQAKLEGLLYEGLISSHSASQIISSVKQHLHKATVDIETPTSAVFAISFYGPPSREAITAVINRANVGGWFVAVINVINKNDFIKVASVEEAISTFNNLKPHKRNTIQIVVEAKYGINVVEDITKRYKSVYHTTPSTRVEKILKLGLSPRSESKMAKHPERIYFALDIRDVSVLSDHMNQLRFEQGLPQLKFVTLVIDTEAFRRPGIRVYTDPAFPEGVFTLSNIAPQYIKIQHK